MAGNSSPLHLLQSLRHQFPLPQVLRHGDRELDLLTRVGQSAHFHQQVAANAVKQVISSQSSVSGGTGYGIERIKPGGRALRHTHSHGSIQATITDDLVCIRVS